MSNNIYGQQIYGQGVLASHAINRGPIIYQQFGQYQQQPIYYGQNQNYIGGVYNQQPKNVEQSYLYNQVSSIPGIKNNYQQVQNNQIQNIYQQQNNQFNLYQQNQYKNIYQQQLISHQQVQKNQMIKQPIVMNNQLIQQKSKIQQIPNKQTYFPLTNPQIIQNQVKSVSKVNEFYKIEKEALIYGKAKPMTKNEIDELYSYESAVCKIKFKVYENGQIKDSIGTGFFL